MATAKKHDWSLIFMGIAVFIVGLILVIWPGLALFTIAIVAGIVMLSIGIMDVVSYVRYRQTEQMSVLALLYGICNILLGAMFLLHPIVTSVVIPWIAGAFLIAFAIFEIIATFRERGVGMSLWIWTLLGALVDLLCGIMFIVVPAVFGLFLAFFLLMRGILFVVFGWCNERVAVPGGMNYR